jgi:hypothetical protein
MYYIHMADEEQNHTVLYRTHVLYNFFSDTWPYIIGKQ